MKDRVQVHKYTKHFETPPNALTSSGIIEGALIKHMGGHGCLQPWPWLGDKDLNYHLQSIIKDEPTEQALACLKCCEIDANARSERIDLFNNIKIPRSHLLVSSLHAQNINDEIGEGFNDCSHIKLKGNHEVLKIAQYIEKIPENISIRIDFNSSLTPEQLVQFTQQLTPDFLQRIDFIEDPFPYEPIIWDHYSKLTGLKFALDRGPIDADMGFTVRIWKPTIVSQIPDIAPICVTHNMDHELGMRYAAYQASIINNTVTVHGTGTFDESKNGYGLGMAQILDELHWEELS